MPPTVSNTSPLIWLAKIGKLNLLKDLFDAVLISEETYREAVEVGLKEGYSDALVIKDACDQGWITVEQLDEKQSAICQKIMQHSFELHEGEAKAIVLAREIGKDTLLLMDDSSGRAFAETWGLKVKGIIYVIITALRNNLLDKAEAKEAVLNLVVKGFRIEPKLLAKIIQEIEKENTR
jgi:predicted nucleic acid-binding protein